MAEKLLFAGSVEEALDLKQSGSAFLAGGTEINRLDSSVTAGTLISIRKIKALKEITKDNGKVWFGSAVTFQNVIESELAPEYFRDACRMMASRTKRNMATIGGNIALARDDSYIVPALIAARAEIVYHDGSADEKSCCVCEFVAARKEGRLADALIIRIGMDPDRKVLNKRYANTAMSYSMLNISFGCEADGTKVSIASAIKNRGIYRMECLEKLIEADPSVSEQAIIDKVNSCTELDLPDDMYGSKEYKRYLLGTTIARLAIDAR